jgi:hypothetical protein
MSTTAEGTVLTRHEKFWLDVIRLASRGRDPVPTLKRAQQLRLIFEQDSLGATPRSEVG